MSYSVKWVKGSCIACVICTTLMIYAPMFLKGKELIPEGAPDYTNDAGVRMSFACIMAGAASMVLDFILDLTSVVSGTAKGSSGRLLSQVLLLFVLFWPSLHLFCSSRLSVAAFVYDALLQRYIGLVLIAFFLKNLDKEQRWSWYFFAGIVGSLSAGIILFVMLMHFGLSANGFIAGKIFEVVSALGVLCQGVKSFPRSENSLVLTILTGSYVGLILMLVTTQTALELHVFTLCRTTKIATNYLIVAACTIPVVMPARFEREKARCAEKANEFRTSFVRYISHEIRTPMNVTTVGVAIIEDFLKGKELLVGEIGEIVDQTRQALNISTEILNDMLTYEKLNANAMVLEQTLERPLDFVMTAAGIFEFQARDKGIQFILPSDTSKFGDTFIFIDTYKMSQVIRNLISNALKFTAYGGTIIVECDVVDKVPDIFRSNYGMSNTTPTNDWLRISVVDDGVGIAPDNIGKLFKGIIQFDANKLQCGKGTGLGMFISSGIVELHGGTIAVCSEGLGRGCTFTVELPLIRSNKSYEGTSKRGPLGSRINAPSSNVPGIVRIHGESTITEATHGDTTSRPSYRIQPHLPTSVEALDEGHALPTTRWFSPRGTYELVNVAARQTSNAIEYSRDIDRAARQGDLPMAPQWARQTSNAMEDSRDIDRTAHPGDLPMAPTAPKWESCRPRKNAYETLKDMESGKLSVPHPGEGHIRSQFSTIDLRDCRVLIVDDSPMNLKMMTLMIKKFGADCVSAVNGAEAVKLVSDSIDSRGPRIDIVIMDNNMDVMNGPQACRLMRDAGFTHPIFGLTGDTDEKSDQQYFDAGVNHILRKPLKLEEIINALTCYSI
jgi:signal transduction histidine kinase